jgi:ATP-dependent protease ClpP protease subunit
MDYKTFVLIDDWKKRVDDHQKTSYSLAVKHNKFHYGLGLPAVVFAASAAAALLLSAEEPWIRITFGIVGLLAALLSIVQTFYSHGKKAENQLFVVSQLVQIRRDIELFEKFLPEKKSERQQRIRLIDERLSIIEEDMLTKDVNAKVKKWPWILAGSAGAVLVIVLLALVNEWMLYFPETDPSVTRLQRESIQQGVVTWEFDPDDPLIEQRIILVNNWINELTTQKVITLLTYLNEKDNHTPITILLSSNGGYTRDAYAIVHAIQESDSIVDTVALGDCFSACAQILMSGTGSRKVAQNSRIAIHTHSYPYDGDPNSQNTILYEREWEFFRNYSALPPDWINHRQERFYYLSPEQAVSYQIVDEILDK